MMLGYIWGYFEEILVNAWSWDGVKVRESPHLFFVSEWGLMRFLMVFADEGFDFGEAFANVG